MNRFLVAALGALLVVGLGGVACQDKDKSGGGDPKMMSTDACPHCAGVQKANADGTCPKCGMKMTDAKMMSADACPKCEGVQAASADGKCAVCEAKKAGAGAAAADGDVCTHCPGVQAATADGKCPVCQMAVK